MADQCDVMISFVESNKELVEFLVGKFREKGISVFYSTSAELTDKERAQQRAQAVVKCKVFVLVVSEESVVSHVCRDELSLAYISNSFIFPVSTKYFPKIAPYLDAAMKLMLAKINWSFFTKPEDFENNISALIDRIKEDIQLYQSSDAAGSADTDMENMNTGDVEINKFHFSSRLSVEEGSNQDESQEMPFWDKHFGEAEEVSWKEFKECFFRVYEVQLKEDFGEEKLKWFQKLLYKDVFESKNSLQKGAFAQFLGKSKRGRDDDVFYTRLTEYAVGSLAIREVFNMDSTVRLTAIQNLGSYQTPSVVSALFKLVEDADPNVRAVAVLALVKTGKKSKVIADKLIAMLHDEDRLVRESCCLSLAHMRATQAVPYILDVWRNEPIKNVREAAELALNRIGGDEAGQAVKVTKVLSEEMASLRSTNK